MFILTVIHHGATPKAPDTISRLCIGCENQARSTYHQLVHIGYDVEVGVGDLPERDEEEMRRVANILDVLVHGSPAVWPIDHSC